MRNLILSWLGFLLLGTLGVYGATAFVFWSLDPVVWSLPGRLVAQLLVFGWGYYLTLNLLARLSTDEE